MVCVYINNYFPLKRDVGDLSSRINFSRKKKKKKKKKRGAMPIIQQYKLPLLNPAEARTLSIEYNLIFIYFLFL